MSLALDSQRVALDVHRLLLDLDPARFRDDLDASVRARAQGIVSAASGVLDRARGERQERVYRKLAEVRDILMQHVPSEGREGMRERWHALVQRCQPAYEALAQALRAQGSHVPSLRPTNYLRNVYHVANAVGIIMLVNLVLVPWGMLRGTALVGFGLAWTLELLRWRIPAANRALMRLFAPVAHPQEAFRVNSATWYATALVMLAWFVPVEIGSAALAILGLGDPAAAIIGRRFGKTKLIHGRSLEGTLAFFVAGTLAATATWALAFSTPLLLALAYAVPAALAGAIAELVAKKVDDNLLVPLAAAIAGMLVI